ARERERERERKRAKWATAVDTPSTRRRRGRAAPPLIYRSEASATRTISNSRTTEALPLIPVHRPPSVRRVTRRKPNPPPNPEQDEDEDEGGGASCDKRKEKKLKLVLRLRIRRLRPQAGEDRPWRTPQRSSNLIPFDRLIHAVAIFSVGGLGGQEDQFQVCVRAFISMESCTRSILD
ncbi:hypothetical protein MUK42_15924, partial [Musa troglodytarum]